MTLETEAFFTLNPLRHPTADLWQDLRARADVEAMHSDCTIVEINGHPVWRPDAELVPDDMRCFFDGDVRDVLEMDDPRIEAQAAETGHARLIWK